MAENGATDGEPRGPEGLLGSGPDRSATGSARPASVVAAGESAAGLPKIISFSSLVRCGDEVWIEHAGSLYRLRRTKQDKLILTK